MNIPNAVEIAEKLIEGRPDLFPGNLVETTFAITKAMVEYKNACNKFTLSEEVNSDNFMDTIIGIVKDDAKQRLGIDLDLKTDLTIEKPENNTDAGTHIYNHQQSPPTNLTIKHLKKCR